MRHNVTFAYRPQGFNGSYRIKTFLRHGPGYLSPYKWHERTGCNVALFRIGGRIHYLASHAPINVRKRWTIVQQKFMQRYRKSF